MRSDRERLADILEAIERIEGRAPAGAREAFRRDEMLQVWVLYHVQLIGEAAARLSEELRSNHADIPWADITAMRNFIVHQYFSTDLDQVWYTVEHDLPVLKEWVRRVLAGLAE